jgi:MFS family permease
MDTLYQTLLRKRLWIMFLSYFLWIFAITLMIPHVTPISVDFFASKAAGTPVTCEKPTADTIVPDACAAGSATAVRYVSITSFISSAILGVLVSPLVGWLSDAYGRKPFFLLGVSFMTWDKPASRTPSRLSPILPYFSEMLMRFVLVFVRSRNNDRMALLA